MRFKLTLEVDNSSFGNILPLNYQYEQSAAVYKILSRASSQYSSWLHDNGFSVNESGKRFKLFTFSRFIVDNFRILRDSGRLVIFSPKIYWYLSFLPEQSTEKFIQGIFLNQVFEVGDVKSVVRFRVANVEVLRSPDFSEEMSFTTLSPVCVRNKRADGGVDYISPDSSIYEKALLDGLLSRYSAFYNKPYPGEAFLNLEILSEPKSVLITIKAGTERQTRVRGYLFKFKLRAPTELMRLMYEGGMGEECAQGFGCVEAM